MFPALITRAHFSTSDFWKAPSSAGVMPPGSMPCATSLAVKDPDTTAKLVAQGIEPGGMTPAELGAFQKSEVEKWARVIKAGNIKLD